MKKNKTLVIKSKVRFIIFISFIIMIAAACLSMAINTIDVSAENHDPSYVTVKVCDGDTLWSIADQYMTNTKDQREAVYEIQQANDMASSDTLTAGTTIKVPAEE